MAISATCSRLGEYPFRDGTIAVTAAELAVWRQSPGAGFQLMRKHPIHGQVAYVLGRQVDPQTHHPHPVYESSNGDIWYLTQDPRTGARAVMHQPNPQSGGKVSYIDVDLFLRESPEGPQQQALRCLLGNTAG